MAIIKLLIDGGDMKPGPAVGQRLGPLGINIGKVVQEVNSATKDFKGLKAFKTDYPMAECYMIYRGESQYYEHDIQVLPMQKVLFDLSAILKVNDKST